jgi:DNA-directed RNA polymerase subunit RPC12/RpoP
MSSHRGTRLNITREDKEELEQCPNCRGRDFGFVDHEEGSGYQVYEVCFHCNWETKVTEPIEIECGHCGSKHTIYPDGRVG